MNKQKSPKAEIQHAQKEGLEKEISPKLDIKALSQEQKREIIRELSIEEHYSGPLTDGENNCRETSKPSDRDGKKLCEKKL